MKKKALILITLFLLLVPTAFSKIISQSEAEKFADLWIQIENMSQQLRSTKEKFTISSISELNYKGEQIGFIARLEPRGFMIISGISELAPLKFISYTANYDQIKDHLLIEGIRFKLYYTLCKLGYSITQPVEMLELEVVRNDLIDAEQKELNVSIWDEFLLREGQAAGNLTITIQAKAPLLTSKWAQRSPYNGLTPLIKGENCLTGCSATAQAQVMNYWKYPKMGQGEHSYEWDGADEGQGELSYEREKTAITIKTEFNTAYDWDNMLDEYTGAETTEQNNAVAKLIADVGGSIDMDYGINTSGAFIDPEGLAAFFKYSSDAVQTALNQFNGSAKKWFNLHKKQIKKGWPVLYSTWTADLASGHTIVIDGYRVQNKINQVHCNMGWGGAQDNYYTIDNIYNKYGSTIDRSIYNIHPPETEKRGSISGSVSSGQGNSLNEQSNWIKHVQAKAYSAKDSKLSGIAWTDANGEYKIENLKAGDHKVQFDGFEVDYGNEWYNDKNSIQNADEVNVKANEDTPNIDAQLAAVGRIAGKVTDIVGKAIERIFVCVYAYDDNSKYLAWKYTDSNGTYLIDKLTAGKYKVRFWDFDNVYQAKWYKDKDSFENAKIVKVKAKKTKKKINAKLAKQ